MAEDEDPEAEVNDEAWSTRAFRDVDATRAAVAKKEGGFGMKWKLNVGWMLRVWKRRKKDKKG